MTSSPGLLLHCYTSHDTGGLPFRNTSSAGRQDSKYSPKNWIPNAQSSKGWSTLNQRWCLDPAKTENSEWTAIYLDRKTLVGSLHVSTTKPSIWEKYRPLVLGRLAVATKRDKQFGAPMSCLHLRIFTIPFRAIISPASQRLDEGRQREKGENERHVGEIKSGRLPNKAQWT